MAKVLVLETDPVSAALLEDRLYVSGHRVTLVEDPAQAVSRAAEGGADLLILEMELPVVPGLEVIRQLRAESETRSLPIVALSRSDKSADRVKALRAGADDYLNRPFDAEELLLRVDRLLGRRGAAPAVMKGDLANHPCWELVQYIQHTNKTGELTIQGLQGSGRLEAVGGRVINARWQHLRDRDALLAMLEAREGSFRLTTEDGESEAPESGGFPIPEVLMYAAWLEDQLAKRRSYLPATGAPLRRVPQRLPEIDEEFHGLPFEAVLKRVEQQPGTRLYDLIHDTSEAPPKIRLTVAWLCEHGVLEPDEVLQSEIMSTTEISTSMVLDLAVHNLLSAARDSGLDTSTLSYLLLAEPGIQPQLEQLLVGEPGVRGIATLTGLAEQLKLRKGGSADFVTDFGTLSLHAQILSAELKLQIEAIVPACAGVLLWLDEGREADLVQSVVKRLETAGSSTVGIVVAPTRESIEPCAELIDGSSRWRTSHLAPRSLIGILRLLHPRAA